MRNHQVNRSTNETQIQATLNLDGTGHAEITTGIGFFDHMLDLFTRHGLFDLDLKVVGDLHIDQHHSVEDTGIVLGQALHKALGDKKGINRYASVDLPMDETLTRVCVDVSGRPFLVFKTQFPTPQIGTFDTQLVQEFFQAFATHAGITLHVETFYGTNSHHIAESCFKGLARALRVALSIDPREAGRVPSTKGSL